jgi:NHLM bacteriocin system ABC transporter ATP-binding protein
MSSAQQETTSALARIMAEEGELVHTSGLNPFLLNGPDNVWYLERGQIEVFTVSIKDGEPEGARVHFISVAVGELIFGMDLDRYGMGSGFLAVGRVGTTLRRISREKFQELTARADVGVELVELLDTWVFNMSKSLTKDIIPGPIVDVNVTEGQQISLQNQKKLRSNRGVLWLDVKEGDLLFIGMEDLVFSGAAVFFPITPDTWVEAANATGIDTVIHALSIETAVTNQATWWGLDLFHEALCQCEFINKKLATVDEFNRLKSKAEYAAEAEKAANRELASVLSKTVEEEEAVEATTDQIDSILAACKLVGDYLDFKVVRHPSPREKANMQERVAEIAKASRFRTRVIALRDDWYKRDGGPVFGFYEEGEGALAFIPTGPTSYVMYDISAGTKRTVNEKALEGVSPFGLTFYRPFPDGPLGVPDLVKFGAHGITRDFILLGFVGVALGLLGTLVPYATGQIFDVAIPQADKFILLQFTIALFVSAITSMTFKIVQSISVIRIQGRMDYSIQGALWDRLLNLPTTFFSKYEAGDLADRASGVNAIRDLLAGAGVSAILGATSSVFYVFLMFKYSVALGALAMGLTFIFVVFTTSINYVAVRYQRKMMKSNGKIAGLALQLISGVAKLRTSGAENHAFRTWAHEWANQRRLNFKAGTVQNYSEVFNSSFPIVSSMAIFYVLVSLTKAGKASLTTGDFIAFSAAYGLFTAAMMALAAASMQFNEIVPIYERFKPILTEEAEVDDSKTYPGTLTGSMELSHIHFRYTEDGPWILNDISLKIDPGEFVAFVGGSGSGKSTLMRLMLGFEKPDKGTVYFDGQDISTLDVREVRQQMGVVLQTSRVLPTDIFRNIVGTSSLTLDDAWAAAESAAFADDIREMPMGMHTYVAEGGGGFSGGQKQRLLIARAIVNKPRIIFLDEATSALDNRTQAVVTESMAKLQAVRIAIAHRLSTIIMADRICVLDKGVIKEQGSAEELMKLDGMFAELARRQEA